MLVQTPDGRSFVVPDNLGIGGGGVPDMQQLGIPEYSPGLPPNLPPPPPPPPPVQRFGLGPGDALPEITVPAEVGGGDIPLAPAPEMPTGIGGQQNAPDFAAGTIGAPSKRPADDVGKLVAPPAAAAPPKPYKPPTLEQRIERAAEEAAGAVEEQADLARAQSGLEAAQLGNVAAIEQEGLTEAERVRAETAKVAAERQAGLKAKETEVGELVKRELDTKIDEGRFWKTRTTGQKIVAAISVALSGLGDALNRRTGPNMALQIIQQAAADDVAAQVREREQLGRRIGYARNSLDDYRAATGDMMEAQKLKLSEGLDRTAQKVRVTAAQYGSEAAKMRGEVLALSLEGEAAKLRTQTAESAFNRDMNRKQLAVSQGQLALGRQNLDENKRQFNINAALRAQDLDLQGRKLAFDASQALDKEDRAFGIGTVAGVDDKGQVQYGKLTNADGKTFRAPTEKEAQALREQKGAVDTINQLVSEIERGIAKHGGESDYLKSADWQRVTAKKTAIINELRTGYQMGALDKGALEVAENMLGGVDPTSFIRDARPGLRAAAENIAARFNNNLIASGYSGPAYKPVGAGGFDGPGLTDTDYLMRTGALTPLDERRGGYSVTSIAQNIGAATNAGIPGQMIRSATEDVTELPRITQALNGLYATASSSNPDVAATGLAQLANLAQNADSAGVRRMAQQYLDAANARSIGGQEATSTRSATGARDDISTGRR